MKAVFDRAHALDAGLAAIREQFQLPAGFPPEVEQAAERAALRKPGSDGLHRDRTAEGFVTLDPISSTDLDQAFRVEAAGRDLLLHYAIADIGWFVEPEPTIEAEAWTRGETIYLPDGKVPLYPPVLSEGAASLLPGVARPAIVFTVRIDPVGQAKLEGVERAVVTSRAKLGYATVRESDLPPLFFDLASRITVSEKARGASRVDPPQQEVVATERGYRLYFRPMSKFERANAALSLAANLAIAKELLENRTGLFRVMEPPRKNSTWRFRRQAEALGVDWPKKMSLEERQSRLDPNVPKDAALMLAIRRGGSSAKYAPYVEGVKPWHSAVAATYVHATAPLRRLADRYVDGAALEVANGRSLPFATESAFQRLPEVMAKGDTKAAQVEAAVVELAESVALSGQVGREFSGRVADIDPRGARIQLCDLPVVTRVNEDGLELGQPVDIKLVEADPARRLSRFALA